MRFRKLLALSAAFIPASVYAQSPAPEPAPAAADNSSMQISDIVVTAQRRAENLQKSSLALQVVTAEQLRGVSQPVDLTRIVPSLQLSQIGSTAQIFIRGVGTASNTGATDSGVAFNVDGVYIAQPVAYGLDFFDLARTEVLKGPQGTLYGRNATGGAVNLITNVPANETGGYVNVDIGSYSLVRTTGALNLAASDEFAVRAAFNLVRRDGYYDDGSGDDRQEAARVRVKWNPGSGPFQALLSFGYGHVGGVGGGSAVLDGNADGSNPAGFMVPVVNAGSEYKLVHPWAGQLDPFIVANYGLAPDTSQKPYVNIKAYSATAQLDYDLGSNTTFTFLPAYRHVTQKAVTYSAQFIFQPLGFDYKQTSLEARLGHNGSDWKWVAGLYYFHNKQDTPFYSAQKFLPAFFGLPPFSLPPSFLSFGLQVAPDRQITNSYSAFGESTYSVSSAFRVIAGLRYTKERARNSGEQLFTAFPGGAFPPVNPVPFAARVSAKNVSWKAGFEYDLTPASMLFGTVSTGFKAGGVFPGNPPRNSFKPEKLLAFELGSRNRFMDNRVQLNLEAFYWKYTDKQEQLAGFDGCGSPTCGGTLNNLTLNAGKAEMYGLSVDAIFRLTGNDTFHAGGEYNHNKYTDFNYFAPLAPASVACPQTPTAVGGVPGFNVNCTDYPLTRAPRWVGTADYQHRFDLAGGANITFGASMTYTSSRYLDAHFYNFLKAPAYALFNSDLTYTAPDDKWSVSAYIRNIGDKAAPVTAYSNADNPLAPYTAATILNPPRTYGVRGNFKF